MSALNQILAEQNAIKEQLDAIKYEDYQNKAMDEVAAKKQSDIDVYSSGMNSQISNTQNYYDKQIGDTKIKYESDYERNAVQKLINEKQIAEKNANLGLTDSGLNRTQQTATQLSYANSKGDIDLARQSALDNLTLAMTDAITTLENEKTSGIRDIENTWDSYANTLAQNRYNSDVTNLTDKYNLLGEQAADIYKAEVEAAAAVAAKMPTVSYGNGGTSTGGYIIPTNGSTLSYDYYGSLADNNIRVIYNNDGTTTYVDNNSGKVTTIDSDINPYTGDRNADVDYGVFKNGYQPNNIRGVKVKKVENAQIKINGRTQSVWAANNKFYFWDGSKNKYEQMTEDELEGLGLDAKTLLSKIGVKDGKLTW